MPFINDVLENNREQLEENNIKRAGQRVSRFRFEPSEVIELLSSRIVGQQEMITAVGDMLHMTKADFNSQDRPLAVFFFLGSTGVGKTETVRILSEKILGSKDQICRIDMNTLVQEHYAAAITGAPPGYVGSKENNTLLDSEKIEGSFSRPGIVLFDEIEKASKEVIRTLLNILDTGQLNLSGGTKNINFRNAMIFMTSNLGAQALMKYRRKFESGWRSWCRMNPSKSQEKGILQEALQRKFDPEFLNRIDRTVFFERLDSRWLDQLLTLELLKLNKRLSKCRASIELTKSAKTFLLTQYDKEYGARHLIRMLRSQLEPNIAKALNSHPDKTAFLARLQGTNLEVIPTSATK
ncbi:MAG: AAA family ATPase [Verrucomicrobiota bacterium]